MVTKFAKHLSKSDLSKNTVTSYVWTVTYFLAHYKEINSKNLLAYKGYLLEKFKPQTVNLRLQGMNKFLEFISPHGLPPLSGLFIWRGSAEFQRRPD